MNIIIGNTITFLPKFYYSLYITIFDLIILWRVWESRFALEFVTKISAENFWEVFVLDNSLLNLDKSLVQIVGHKGSDDRILLVVRVGEEEVSLVASEGF